MKRIDTRKVPQANSLDKVCSLVAVVDIGLTGKMELAEHLGLVPREVDYYRHAASILGFATKDKRGFKLSEAGLALLDVKSPTEKNALLARSVRQAEVFKELLAIHKEASLDKAKIITFLLQRTNLNRTTAARRADTVLVWLKATQ